MVSVFLMTLDCNLAFYCADVFARFILVDYLKESFETGLIPLFAMTARLLSIVDRDVYMLVTCNES